MLKLILGLVLSLSLVSQTRGTDYAIPVVTKQRQVQFNADTYRGYSGYYAIGQEIEKQKQAQTQTDLVSLKEELAEIAKAIRELKGNVSGDKDTSVTPEPPKVDKVTSDFTTLMKTKCYTCHKGGTATGFEIFDKEGNLTVDLPKSVWVHKYTEGITLGQGEKAMPKGGKLLTNDEMKIVKLYVEYEAKKLLK
jgi:hypothetical protein